MAPVRLASLRCDCGAAEVFAVVPGADPCEAPGGIVVERGVPARAWCERCWRARWSAAA